MAVLQGKLPGTYAPPAKVRNDAEDNVSTLPGGSDDVSGRTHRQLIGSVGFFLPVLLYLFAAVAPNDAAHRWTPLWSISAYYYTSGVVAFIGLLVALSLYLFAYEGYANEWHDRDIWWSRFAAWAALGVALFPTIAPVGLKPQWWVGWMQWAHYISAFALFSAFAFFCLKIFTLPDPRGANNPDRAWQNRIYRICGIIIIGGMIATAVLGRFFNVPIFYPESVMLFAFATSWLVKGRIYETTAEAIKKKA